MMSMIKYGAQEIISTADKEVITEADIDKIISHANQKTALINKSLESLEEKFNLNTVSLTGDDPERYQSLYTFEGQEYSRKLD